MLYQGVIRICFARVQKIKVKVFLLHISLYTLVVLNSKDTSNTFTYSFFNFQIDMDKLKKRAERFGTVISNTLSKVSLLNLYFDSSF